jgi:hypothetical protein
MPNPAQRCHVGIAGTGPKLDLAGQGHECVESTLAKEKCGEGNLSREWFKKKECAARQAIPGRRLKSLNLRAEPE